MAVAPITCAVDFNRKLVFANPINEAAYTFQQFFSGDTPSFQVYLVKAGTLAGNLTALSTAGLTLKVALGVRAAGASGTVYTSVTLAPDATNTWLEGVLPLNVAAVASLFASLFADVPVKIEFELSDTGISSCAFDTTIVQQIIGNALQDTPLPDVAIGKIEADGRYVPQADAQGFIMVDSDGSGRRYFVKINDGVLRADPIS